MKKYLLIAISAAMMAGCTTPDIFNENASKGTYSNVKDPDIIGTSHKAGEGLMSQATYLQNDLKAILITSVADITDLNSSSALGLMVSEQIGNRFAQFGFPVVDLRTRHDVKVREKSGEYMLSRDIQKISKEHAAGAVLVGTYAVGRDHVYVSTRLIRPEDNRILASYDFDLPMGPDVRKMARQKTR
ncbi:FlgO family outer membrane protein [Ostreibacterium oceani]|uniref:FlgO domain-containing protein n=1 Tax=Ostreibacterium oceani TaxID=2654998 RepID=A0A6N7EYK8_9GAMM|nr:FlgO family outer membrane protein [Ostreibacterium oceani]MPV86227.1 hypothetical protein [Ostreibacterium oceani]